VLRADGQHGQHLVGLEAAQRERERLKRGRIGPVGIFQQQQQQHGPAILDLAEQLQQPRANLQRVPP
jgi:hypothetical protein